MWNELLIHSETSTAAWTSYQIRKIAGWACVGNAGNVFPRRRFQRKPLVNDAGMDHGTCVTHVPWCMPGSLTWGDGENVPDIPCACAPVILRIWQEAHGDHIPNVHNDHRFQLRTVQSRLALNHCDRVTHICVGSLAIIGSDNGLSPGRCQAIIWTNAGILLSGPRNKCQWKLYRHRYIFIQEYAVENVAWEMAAISYRP